MKLAYIQQKGVALLTILLMVMVASILATTMLAKQNRSVRETSVMIRQDNVYSIALAGEQRAIALLKEDAKLNKTDSLQDVWANPANQLDLPLGKVSVSVSELSGKYNINNLHYAGKIATEQKAYFERLLSQLGLEKTLVDAVIDWQDADDSPIPETGAELEYYRSEGMPQPSNQDFQSIDELAQVKGFDSNALQAIKPYIIALPVYTKVNVNTAPFPVLAALGKDLDSATVLSFTESRQNSEPLAQVSQLFSQPAFSSMKTDEKQAVTPLLSVDSQLFAINSTIELDGKVSYLTSYVFKHEGELTVFQRDFSTINPQTYEKSNTSLENGT